MSQSRDTETLGTKMKNNHKISYYINRIRYYELGQQDRYNDRKPGKETTLPVYAQKPRMIHNSSTKGILHKKCKTWFHEKTEKKGKKTVYFTWNDTRY